jgi:hypothetical protein
MTARPGSTCQGSHPLAGALAVDAARRAHATSLAPCRLLYVGVANKVAHAGPDRRALGLA